MWQLVFASRHRLIPQQEEQHAKRVSDGHGRSFGSWPGQKNAILVLPFQKISLQPEHFSPTG